MTEPQTPSMLSFVNDLPNLCSLAGLLSATAGIYFAMLQVFPAAMIALLWAVFFDWGDGLIARRMENRTPVEGHFGKELDSLIDVVSFGVFPAVVLLSYGNFQPWFLPGAFFILATSVIRLSHFNIFGLVGGSYKGLALDNNSLVLAFVFLFADRGDGVGFTVFLYVLLMAMAALNVAPITTPKLTGRWFYALTGYVIALTGIYGWKLQ